MKDVERLSGPDWTLSRQKEQLDIATVAGLSPLLGSISMVAYAAIKQADNMDPLFEQTRYGLNFEPFVMYKFRTMPPGTPETSSTGGSDDRATTLGNRLRRTRLDEIPQAWNVLKRDMSVVGPRPLIEQDVVETLDVLKGMEREEWIASRQTARPGITNGYSARLHAGEAGELEVYARAMDDIAYAATATRAGDIRIILESTGAGLQGLLRAPSAHETRGYRKGAKLLEMAALSMDVQLSEHESRLWRAVFGAARALDDVVDGSHQESVDAEMAALLSGRPIGAMTVAHACEFRDVINGISVSKRDAVVEVFMSLPDFAMRKFQASTAAELYAANEAEAKAFADLLMLDPERQPAERTRFNAWMRSFIRAGYMVDTATDMLDDSQAGLITVNPHLGNRAHIAARALPEVLRAVKRTPPKVLMRLATVTMHNTFSQR